MKKSLLVLIALSAPVFAHADALPPFGAASAYNLVALGTVDSNGNTLITGNISTNADVTGRVAAANQVTVGTTIGSSLNADPWGASATYDVVSTNGFNSGEQFNVNSHGNVYAPGSNGNINFNGGGHRVTSGGSGIDFNSLRSTLDAETTSLAGLTVNGVNKGTNSGISGVNPSFYVLQGTSSTLNVFTISASALNGQTLDIIAPQGSTIIVNVTGTGTVNLGQLFYNGNQNSGDSETDSKILFNIPTATTVNVNGQFSASILSPFATLSGNSQMDGTFIAAAIGQTGEVHNVEFDGTLPTTVAATPEPSTLALLGTGVLSIAGLVRYRRKVTN